MLCRLVEYGLGQFQPMKTLELTEKDTMFSYDVSFKVGTGLLQIPMETIRIGSKMPFLVPFKVDLKPEKIKLNLKWKHLLGTYDLSGEERNNILSIYTSLLIPKKPPNLLLVPLMLLENGKKDIFAPLDPANDAFDANNILVKVLNNGNRWAVQEATPVKLAKKRRLPYTLDNLIFASPNVKKLKTQPFLISSDISLNDQIETGICLTTKSKSSLQFIKTLESDYLLSTYSPFEQWKFNLPAFTPYSQPCTEEALNLSFLIFSDREHLLNWNHAIFNDFNIAMTLMPFIPTSVNSESRNNKEKETHSDKSVQEIFEIIENSEPSSNTAVDSIPSRQLESKKIVKIKIDSLMNSALGVKGPGIVITTKKELEKKTPIKLAAKIKLNKSSAIIVVNPLLLNNKLLTKLIMSSCTDMVEISGNTKLAETMPTIIVDESVAVVIINGFLFSQINNENKNIGQSQLVSILKHNILKFQRIYVFVLQYTTMGSDVVSIPVCDCTIIASILISLPNHCTLQMIFEPGNLVQQLIAIFDRQSLLMSKKTFYPLDSSTGLLINIPTLNYIHACCIKSKFDNLFEFIKSTNEEFKSTNYEKARNFMKNKQYF
eukprot:NODE_318_length_11118_cov_0.235049.p1 type:complete len:602 gc:universal NODE_318_length_11118_cov_0.235049:2821-1016(-)